MLKLKLMNYKLKANSLDKIKIIQWLFIIAKFTNKLNRHGSLGGLNKARDFLNIVALGYDDVYDLTFFSYIKYSSIIRLYYIY